MVSGSARFLFVASLVLGGCGNATHVSPAASSSELEATLTSAPADAQFGRIEGQLFVASTRPLPSDAITAYPAPQYHPIPGNVTFTASDGRLYPAVANGMGIFTVMLPFGDYLLTTGDGLVDDKGRPCAAKMPLHIFIRNVENNGTAPFVLRVDRT